MHSPSSRGGNKLCFFLSANSEIDTIANKEIVRNYSTFFNILNSTEYGFFLFSICTNNFYDVLVLNQYNHHSKGFFSDILIGYWPVLHCCLATSNLLTAPRATILSKWWMYTCTNTRNRRDKTFFTVGKNVFGNGTPASHFVHLIQSHIIGFLYI